MFRMRKMAVIVPVIVGTILLLSPGKSFAQRRGWGGRGGGFREREMRGDFGGRTKMIVGGREYFYGDGRFYRYGPRGYAVVSAPIGARLRVLPAGYVSFRIGRIPFFFALDTYYMFDPVARMYVVVEPPPNAPKGLQPPPASPGNYDKLNLSRGEILTGTYLGGSADTIEFQVGRQVQAFAVDSVNSLQFAPPQNQ